MNEYDWSNELKMHRNMHMNKNHAAELRRLSKAARPARVRMTSSQLLGQASAAASRTVAAAGQVVGAVYAWVAGSSEPREECC